MAGEKQSCGCGSADCWELGDYSWLGSYSGWNGELHGCATSVFFIHGKMIREQRHIPAGSYAVEELAALIAKWSQDLPGSRLVWSTDTGDGCASLWIEGERAPNDADMDRLRQVRQRLERDELRELERLTRKHYTRLAITVRP